MLSHRNHFPLVLAITLTFCLTAIYMLLRGDRMIGTTVAAAARTADAIRGSPARIASSSGGWIYVHLEGSPHDIGFQHGYLLAPEIADAFAA